MGKGPHEPSSCLRIYCKGAGGCPLLDGAYQSYSSCDGSFLGMLCANGVGNCSFCYIITVILVLLLKTQKGPWLTGYFCIWLLCGISPHTWRPIFLAHRPEPGRFETGHYRICFEMKGQNKRTVYTLA